MINLVPSIIVFAIWMTVYFNVPKQSRGAVNVSGALIMSLVGLSVALREMGMI